MDQVAKALSAAGVANGQAGTPTPSNRPKPLNRPKGPGPIKTGSPAMAKIISPEEQIAALKAETTRLMAQVEEANQRAALAAVKASIARRSGWQVETVINKPNATSGTKGYLTLDGFGKRKGFAPDTVKALLEALGADPDSHLVQALLTAADDVLQGNTTVYTEESFE